MSDADNTDLRVQLAEIKGILGTMEQRMGDRHAVAEVHRAKIEACLYGTASAPGLKIKTDRIEQTQARQTWFNRTALGSVISLAVGFLWSLLR